MDKYLKKIDGNWCINVPRIELIVNKENVLEDKEIMSIFGFGPLIIVEDENKKIMDERALVLATVFSTKPVEVEKDNKDGTYKLTYDIEHQKSHPICMGQNVISDITNVEMLFDLLSSGKLTNKIDPDIYLDIILNNMNLNEKLDVSERDIELLLANYIRDAKNPSKPLRTTGKKEYVLLSYKNLVAQQSTFAAMTYEDPKTMMSVSLVKDDSKEAPSPLEKYMKL
ncbi:MAG: hypothetical protein ACOCRK_06035 [bacterium]